MATDVPTLKARLADERAAVAAEIASIDVPAEKALLDAAQATLNTAQRAFDKKSERWTLISEKLERLAVLDAQIALFP